MLLIDFTQTQERAFEFSLDYSTDGTLHHIDIHYKTTHVELPLPEKPTLFTPDPNVNILASFEVTKL